MLNQVHLSKVDWEGMLQPHSPKYLKATNNIYMYLVNTSIFYTSISSIHSSWTNFFNINTINMLCQIEKDIGPDYVPCKKEVLRFATTDLNNVKVVIFGRDPYPKLNNNGKPMATGRAFEVRDLKKWDETMSPSLRNILKALYVQNKSLGNTNIKDVRNAIATGAFKISTPDVWFNKMVSAGVIWLNGTLTCERNGDSGSHETYWKGFCREIAKYISQNNNIYYVLLGDNLKHIKKELTDRKVNSKYIIEDVHPVYTKKFITNNTLFKKSLGINWVQ